MQYIKPNLYFQKYLFDFYFAYHLWWTYGSGKKEYGYEQTNFLSGDKEIKIEEFCLNTFDSTKKFILEQLEYCIRREMRYVIEKYDKRIFSYYNFLNGSIKNLFVVKEQEKCLQVKFNKKYHKDFFRYLELIYINDPCFDFFLKGFYCRKRDKKILRKAENMYNAPQAIKNLYYKFGQGAEKKALTQYLNTNDSKSYIQKSKILCGFYDGWYPQYGSEPWKKACELWLKLCNSKTTKNDIFYIDQIFDLEHNTGNIFSKSGCKFNIEQEQFDYYLDLRSKFRSTKDFENFLSCRAKKLCKTL